MGSLNLLISQALRLSPRFSVLLNGVKKVSHSKLCLRHSSTTYAKVNLNSEKYTLKFNGPQVEVKDPTWDQSIQLPFVWLRDHCRCPKCYNHDTHQRNLDLLSIPDDIYPATCSLENNMLRIKWPDDHYSEYHLDWLWKSSLTGYAKEAREGPGTPILWDSSPESVGRIAKVPLASYMSPGKQNESDGNSPGLVEVVRSLVKYGVAFVTDVHPSLKGTQEVVEQLALIKHTHFGGMFEFGDAMNHADTSYTNAYIGAHTDNTYFKEAAGLLVLHCVHHEGVGGENILVDGLRAAEELRRKDPEAHKCLTEEEIEGEYIDDGNRKHYCQCGPILHYSKATGQFIQLRFNLYDRAPLRTLPADRIPKFYSALKKLTKELTAPEAQWSFKLSPGTVMMVDNWRVLHARNEYTGRRKMTGCYVDRGDFESTARLMGLL
ncbi:trimethyllysine dioxygenase, mitochondrial [Ischnura elegans]|uniref:trimethyllysine dioxygenase, mitochondrial n=1 Tax=Ischnura elegans TaxID=197161 RepID=UPI001ED878A4|nr:trimethyllysine dioxygenase, mitochondrial [Ischnura elegans]XP_046397548.1 trimethyllysine dioxygenase, mitochondrial [Ischnura elegans]XP_046397549.1 trimethyllysine dioxygenase, mitochondrial [Ischnura elegans]XP_046397550.1 trimethyllysine dioxygenase, mitochondrial [Ischnura elegans]XP_046397551.1 trimethyllysine dioxygenase, mitochondrial [Ischnura elegans]XP_046397552.1 trimethyllysine dioxygenase, mitochondrial [Ischnura elegans]